MAQAPFRHKNIRLPAENYRGRKLYFLTLCFYQRRPYSSNQRLAKWLIFSLRKHSANCEFAIDGYCLMPDHLHALAEGLSERSNFIKFIESLKQETAIVFAKREPRRLWQRKYYDRILRREDAVEQVAWYIWMNPVRRGLCETPSGYPFLGSFTEIGNKTLISGSHEPWTPPWKDSRGEPPRPNRPR